MNSEQLFRNILAKKSFLCIGLDTERLKLPKYLQHDKDALFKFNKEIIDNTHDLVIAYKPNIAFYEAEGRIGWEALEKTVEYIRKKSPDILIIADAKRGDIGNTSRMYAKAFFETMDFDAVTVAPYMGEDSIRPFFDFEDKWTIILALTSNKGAEDFQYYYDSFNHQYLFERVLNLTKDWGDIDNTMFVVGATQSQQLVDIRKNIPDHFLLIPGVGAQGGSLNEVAAFGMNNQCGIIVNSSRDIIYADSGRKFGKAARAAAKKLQEEMQILLESYF
ncbi:MAG: orotidine-5'-phosphate decarboxylase [Bacteroidales bacterium]|nr:orotidine-5'-phosphate decarboxylase [Bacteroidales bacterium]